MTNLERDERNIEIWMVPINFGICRLKNYFRKLCFIRRCYTDTSRRFESFFMFKRCFSASEIYELFDVEKSFEPGVCVFVRLCLRSMQTTTHLILITIIIIQFTWGYFSEFKHTLNWRTLLYALGGGRGGGAPTRNSRIFRLRKNFSKR